MNSNYDPRKWTSLADATFNFIATARDSGFCSDLLDTIERRLYDESPFLIHHERKENTNERRDL